jgi:hypothetical protein
MIRRNLSRDQLMEQNPQLEKHNRELMDQIEILRRGLANEAANTQGTVQKEPEQASTSLPANQSGSSSDLYHWSERPLFLKEVPFWRCSETC